MLIGEGPAKDEYAKGKVFQGKTGRELREQYLPRIARVDHNDVYITNVSKCAGRTKSGKIDNPSIEQARACWEFFGPGEMRRVQPEIVVLMGAVAVHAIIGEGIVDLETQHGIPLEGDTALDINGRLCDVATGMSITIPTYHPAAGLHETGWMIALQDSFRRVGNIIRDDWSDLVIDSYPTPSYVDVSSPTGLGLDILRQMLSGVPYIAMDTEYDNGVIHCATLSTTPGQGVYVDARNRLVLDAIASVVNPGHTLVAFHGAPADLPMLAQVGIRPRRWVDTMQEEYWTGEFRIGLKIVSYRHLGMRMREFSEVAGPPSKIRLWEYMESVAARMETAVPAKRKTKSLSDVEIQIRTALKKVRRLTGDLDKEFATLKPWDRIDGWEEPDIDAIVEFANGVRIPRVSITNVPQEEKIQYAVRDSDATLRLLPVVRRRAAAIRRMV